MKPAGKQEKSRRGSKIRAAGGQKSISYSKKRRASLWASLVTVALPDIFMALSAASILAASRVEIL